MRLLPFLPVPLVMVVLGVLRPAILTAGFESVRAFAVTAGVGLAGLLVVAAGWRRWRWRSVWAADVVVLLLVAAVVWPAFRVRTLVEDFPVVMAGTAAATPVAAPSATATPSPSSRPTGTAIPSATRSSTPTSGPASVSRAPLSVSPTPVTSATGTQAVLLASGPLEGIDHHARGTVALYRVGDRLSVRFEDIDVEGTPTPSVHLVDEGERDPDGGRRLGGLKAERGSFSYLLPPDVQPGDVATVLVWCDRYAVPIAAADLTPA